MTNSLHIYASFKEHTNNFHVFLKYMKITKEMP